MIEIIIRSSQQTKKKWEKNLKLLNGGGFAYDVTQIMNERHKKTEENERKKYFKNEVSVIFWQFWKGKKHKIIVEMMKTDFICKNTPINT